MAATNETYIGQWAGRRNRYASRWHRIESIRNDEYLMRCGRFMAPVTRSEQDPLIFTADPAGFGVDVTCKRCR